MLTGRAYMREPWGVSKIYAIDDPSYRGLLFIPKEKLKSAVARIVDRIDFADAPRFAHVGAPSQHSAVEKGFDSDDPQHGRALAQRIPGDLLDVRLNLLAHPAGIDVGRNRAPHRQFAGIDELLG